MVILRPTQKLKALLATRQPAPGGSDTALGDWYVNRLVLDRKPLLILVSSTSLLPLLVPARDVQGLACPDAMPRVQARRARHFSGQESAGAPVCEVGQAPNSTLTHTGVPPGPDE